MSDGVVAWLLGLVMGAVLVDLVLGGSMGSTLDARCAVACAPLVGDDREAACWCGTAAGWKQLDQLGEGR